MKLARVTTEAGVNLIKDRLLDDGMTSPEQREAELRWWLRNSPEDIFVLTAWEKRELIGLVIVQAEAGKQHSWMWMAWVDQHKAPPDLTRQAFDLVKEWSLSRGRKEIRSESARSERAHQRRWGFRPIATIFACDLTGRSSPSSGVVQ
jgi:hypothetical protein